MHNTKGIVILNGKGMSPDMMLQSFFKTIQYRLSHIEINLN